NTDKKYIKQGEASLHVLPSGDYGSTNAYPFIYIGCDRPYFATNDFSDFDYISLDVYNDTDKELTIKMHLGVFGYSGLLEDTPIKTYNLTPNSWNNIVYDFSDGSLKTAFNNLKNVSQIFIQFPEYKRTKDDEVNSLYLDNLKAKVNKNPTEYSKKFKTGEILFFENPQDLNFVDARAYEMNIIFNAELCINTNPQFVTEGQKSLKCEFKKIFIEMDKPFIFTPKFWVPIQIYTETFKRQLAGATGVSIDIINANSMTRNIKAFYILDDATLTEIAVNLDADQIATITIKPDNMADVTAFGIMNYSENAGTYYIDNIKVLTD
ncbi:MAG: hypothetical protein GX299_05295, partial [Epulopiscium sp.]|nr:hypothetical protein [Candidatus Epulonipiscium sp.]